MSKCPLCQLAAGKAKTDKIYYEDNIWIMVDCRSCHIPMLVHKKHVPYIHTALEDLEKLFVTYVTGVDHSKRFVDCRMRALPAHFHAHYRIK